ncbi:MAG: hypothetical protein QF735_11535 [Phycisphaeraceae bacterium]|nr:hypothetical protein [Phycisphaeraceae bacterium]
MRIIYFDIDSLRPDHLVVSQNTWTCQRALRFRNPHDRHFFSHGHGESDPFPFDQRAVS